MNRLVAGELVGTDHVQHDKSVPGGADGQVKQFKNLKAKIPGVVATVKHVAGDGDLVWVFSSDYVVADTFRVVDEKIIEHWESFPTGSSPAGRNDRRTSSMARRISANASGARVPAALRRRRAGDDGRNRHIRRP